MADIVLRDIEKYFGDNYIIRKLNLEIRHREFLVLLGPSGCGKTTTLRAIAGLETIDRGEILIDGRAVQGRQAADRDIAFVFQLFALYPHLTAYDNIAFPLRATRETRAVVDLRVREVARAPRTLPRISRAMRVGAAAALDPADHAILAMRLAGESAADIGAVLGLVASEIAERITAIVSALASGRSSSVAGVA